MACYGRLASKKICIRVWWIREESSDALKTTVHPVIRGQAKARAPSRSTEFYSEMIKAGPIGCFTVSAKTPGVCASGVCPWNVVARLANSRRSWVTNLTWNWPNSGAALISLVMILVSSVPRSLIRSAARRKISRRRLLGTRFHVWK